MSLRAALVLLASSGVSRAQSVPLSGELQVNSYTTFDQRYPLVGADPSGDFVVVWKSQGSTGTDDDGWSVTAQRFEAGGKPLGGEFQVNTYTTGDQIVSGLAVDSSGRFMVVWKSDGSASTDTDGTSITARLHGKDGRPLGDDFQVNTYTTGDQSYPTVAVDGDGNFAVVWITDSAAGNDNDDTSIALQRFWADGNRRGVEEQVNTHTPTGQRFPVVSAESSGRFIVAWMSFSSSGSDDAGSSIAFRRYDVAGQPLGGEQQANTYTTGNQTAPWVVTDPDGGFTVVWASAGSPGSDNDSQSILKRRFGSFGNPLENDLQVNTHTTSAQVLAHVAASARGELAFVWVGADSPGDDSSMASIQARWLAADGSWLGDDRQVNVHTSGSQHYPWLTAARPGEFVIVWDSDGSLGSDDDGFSIQMRHYALTLFSDGFEKGDLSGWSAARPPV